MSSERLHVPVSWTAMRRDRFPYVLALIVVALLLFQRFAVAKVGFGFVPQPDNTVSTGTLFNLDDLMFYGSFIQQATLPDVYLIGNAYSVEPETPAYFNPYFLLIGRIAALCHVQPLSVMFFSGLIAAPIIIVCAYFIALYLGFTRRTARLATVMVAFSSGFTGTLVALKALGLLSMDFSVLEGADYLYQDSITFSAIFAYPYHTVAVALIAVLIVLILRLETLATTDPAFKRGLVGVALLGLLEIFVHPYEGVMLLGTYGLYVILTVATSPSRRISSHKKQIAILCALLVGIVPGVLYALFMLNNSSLSGFANLAMSLYLERTAWLRGYGLLIVAVLIGCFAIVKDRLQGPVRWFALWSVLLFVLLIVVNIKETKIVSGGHLPMAILSGFGWSYLATRLARLRPLAVRAIAFAAFGLLSLTFFLTSIDLYLNVYSLPPRPFSQDILTGLALIEADSEDARPVVLSDPRTGLVLPAVAPVRTWVGHWSLTRDYSERTQATVSAGLLPYNLAVTYGVAGQESGGEYTASPEMLQAVIQDSDADYLLLSKNTPSYGYYEQIDALRVMECFTDYCVFAIDQAAS